MTVEEKLIIGSLYGEAKRKRSDTMEYVYTLFPRLKERKKQTAGTLSGGEQQMAAVGRGLMSLPKLMMLDEPSLGLAPLLVQDIFSIVKRINEAGVTVLLVEQNVRQTLGMCNRAYVLENGRIVLEGPGCELLENAKVKEAFLGI
jgi:branched-chain amino acid transport system ATP-binding protein